MADATQAPPEASTFCWNEILAGDVEKTKKFYTALLGWKTKAMDMGPMGTYTIFTRDDKGVAGCMPNPQPGATPTWMSYIAVDDCDAATKKAVSLGATVCVEPMDIPDAGRMSVLKDPTGASIGLFQAAG